MKLKLYTAAAILSLALPQFAHASGNVNAPMKFAVKDMKKSESHETFVCKADETLKACEDRFNKQMKTPAAENGGK